jgi:hypothetical protein
MAAAPGLTRRHGSTGKEEFMGLFEQYPWLLVPIIIATVEGWSALKTLVREVRRRYQRI